MTLKNERNKSLRVEKSSRGTRLRSAAVSSVITLALAVSALPVLNYENNGDSTVHTDSVNYGLQENARSVENYGVSYHSGKIHYNLPGIPSLKLSSHKSLAVKLSGKTAPFSAYRINGIVYLSIKDALGSVNPSAKLSHNASTKTTSVSAAGLVISVTHGGYVMYANDRPLFSFSPALLMNDGNMYVPASALLKALGLSSSASETGLSISGSFKPLAHASKFYREDEVYWLSKIISAESAGESLLGQIAVGDVIMNRVKSSLFPNTIYSVIFDRKYGVQFSPTLDGRIYFDPTYTATLAAKICLEGVSLSDDAMYFLNPKAAQSNWIVKNREYAYTIGNHDFYE